MPITEHILDCFCGQPLDRVVPADPQYCPRCGRIVIEAAVAELGRSRDVVTRSVAVNVKRAA